MTREIGSECMRYILDVQGDLKAGKKPKADRQKDFSCTEGGFRYMDLFFIGLQTADMYKNAKYKATAVICFNDDMALGMMEGLKKHGISVPDDVSIMGIDGIYTRKRYTPLLTTMAIYPERQGAECVDLLVDVLEGNKYKFMNYSPFDILEGDSVKEIL